MNDVANTTCQCLDCPADACTCGCQSSIACACGPACECGADCQCQEVCACNSTKDACRA